MTARTNHDPAIPDDLKEQYELNKKWLALSFPDRPRSTGSVESILRSDAVMMAERIASLEAENRRLKAPVSDDELLERYDDIDGPLKQWNANSRHYLRCNFNAIIASRLPKPSQPEEPK